MSEIEVKMSEITISLFMITILHQGVSYITLCYCELYCTLQLPFYYSLEPLVEYLALRGQDHCLSLSCSRIQ